MFRQAGSHGAFIRGGIAEYVGSLIVHLEQKFSSPACTLDGTNAASLVLVQANAVSLDPKPMDTNKDLNFKDALKRVVEIAAQVATTGYPALTAEDGRIMLRALLGAEELYHNYVLGSMNFFNKDEHGHHVISPQEYASSRQQLMTKTVHLMSEFDPVSLVAPVPITQRGRVLVVHQNQVLPNDDPKEWAKVRLRAHSLDELRTSLADKTTKICEVAQDNNCNTFAKNAVLLFLVKAGEQYTELQEDESLSQLLKNTVTKYFEHDVFPALKGKALGLISGKNKKVHDESSV